MTCQKIPRKQDLRLQYDEYYIYFSALMREFERFLRGSIVLESVPLFKSRVKTFSSYYSKILRLSSKIDFSTDFPLLTDIVAVRIICPFLEDLASVERQISEKFVVREVERKGTNRSFSEFGYESIHILVSPPEEMIFDKHLPDGILCEIQVRTILQDAWAEVEHELIYKSEFNPFDLPLKRKLASINASLSLADSIFQEIRNYQRKLRNEMQERREEFYKKADGILVESASDVFAVTAQPFAASPSSPKIDFFGTIDDLLLQAIHAQNGHDFQSAIAIYSHIIDNAHPNKVVLAVILNHRGMAHFAQNKFKEARDDFGRASKADENNLRSFYYLGITYSVLGDERAAVENFSKSLELNPFQAHLYFRRSLSYFHLADYPSAMADITRAADLGFSDDDTEKLRQAILKKLDIK